MMAKDRLYELAFQYKKTKLWNSLFDTEIFAVRFFDGALGYCSVMGAVGRHCALGVYVGASGFHTYQNMLNDEISIQSALKYREHLLSQDCIQCAFENKSELPPEDLREAQRYAKEHGITFRGRNSYPQFVSYKPYRIPWFLEDEKEQDYLCQALSAALEVAAALQTHQKPELNFFPLNQMKKTIPLLEPTENGYVWSVTELPADLPEQYPAPKMVNDIALAKLKKIRKEGIFACELVRFPEPIQENEKEAPYFPVIMLAVQCGSGLLLPMEPVFDFEENPEQVLDAFVESLLEEKLCPNVIKTRDGRTSALLEDFCEKVGIRLKTGEKLPVLDEVEDSLFECFTQPQEGEDDGLQDMQEILDILLSLPDAEMRNMPDMLSKQLLLMTGKNILPKELENKVIRVFSPKGGGKAGKKGSITVLPSQAECSYIISVSVAAGCYRHIRISGSDTLEDLHEAIQEAFGFDRDHAYAFFMDDRLWSDVDAYYMEEIRDMDMDMQEAGGSSTCPLTQTGLTEGKKFKYLFDFGDEWVFQCKVLKVLDEKTETPMIVSSKGKAPDQYG